MIFGKHDAFGGLSFNVNGVPFNVYVFLNAVIAFLVIAAIVYFFVVVPVNALIARSRPTRLSASAI